MKKHNQLIKLLLIVFVSITIVSCEKEATIKSPKANSKLVVTSFISPTDTAVWVTVRESKLFYGTSSVNIDDPLTNANVTISNGTTSISLLYNSDKEKYYVLTSTFSINAGSIYYLTVSTPDGRSVSSNTKVPFEYVPIGNLVFNLNANSYSYAPHNLIAYWNDVSGQKNYYKVFVTEVKYDNSLSTDTVFFTQSSYGNLEHDFNKDGQQLKMTIDMGLATPLPTYYAFDFNLLNCNEDYYKYHTSLLNGNGGDFFTEPAMAYSNIEGGHGVFAAYTVSKKRYVYN